MEAQANQHPTLRTERCVDPLTLDLLMDHQGKVVNLQDVREGAQRVRQADLEGNRGALTGDGRLLPTA